MISKKCLRQQNRTSTKVAQLELKTSVAEATESRTLLPQPVTESILAKTFASLVLRGLVIVALSAVFVEWCPVLSASADPDTFGTAAVPAPIGPKRVGTVTLALTDFKRVDPFLDNGSNRVLMVRFWYPTSSRDCRPAPYVPARVWAYLSHRLSVSLPPVRTNSCSDAEVEVGAHPVILATHGYTGMLTDYTFLFEDLASRGYVVVSIAHTYETTAVELPGGVLAETLFGSYLDGSLREDLRSVELARSVRVADLTFVLTELQRLNTQDRLFAGRLDVSVVGVMGHSLGGEASLLILQREPRLRAAALIDPAVSEEAAGGSGKPVLIILAGRTLAGGQECRLWGNLHGPRIAIQLRGGEHLTPSDLVWLTKSLPGLAVATGGMGPDKTVAAIRNYVAAFFDSVLIEKSEARLLSVRSSDYPDALVTTTGQSLCPQAAARAQGEFPWSR
jgi:dienelactone hydrolase